MRLLDRYVLRKFLEPFLICFFGFISIWLVFDLSGKMGDFLDAQASLKQVAGFYLTQLPQIIVLSLPIGLLLALLYSLSSMSRRNEIIAQLTAGRSLGRMLLPLFAVGLVAAAGCFAMNYAWAPHAEAIKETALERITRGEKAKDKEQFVRGLLFRDRQAGRTWFVRKFKPGTPQLEDVHISQQDAEGNIVRKWYANRAIFDARSGTWTLRYGLIVDFNLAGDITKLDDFRNRHVRGWTETPWRIASAQLEAQHLSVPELNEYLTHNADFPAAQLAPYRTQWADRWAFPFSCLVVIFIGAPLGIVFSRRGVLAGVASSIFIFFAMVLLRYLFLALGKGGRLDPWLAAWLPNAVFLALGLYLLHLRANNRELPKLWGR